MESYLNSLHQADSNRYSLNSTNPNMPNVGSRNLSSDTYASDTYADLIRSDYRDYETRFKPYQERLLDLASSTELLDQQLGRISATNKSAYANKAKTNAMNNQRYGVVSSMGQKQSNERLDSISQGLAIAHGKNNTRTHFADQQMGILAGGQGRQMVSRDINQGG